MARKRVREAASGGAAADWYLLIHQLPPRPLYLRARIRQRLDRLGAVALKNSVYALPATPACLEDLEWVAQEAVAGGGEAFVCAADLLVGLDADTLRERFRERCSADYADVVSAVREELVELRDGGQQGDSAAASRALARQRKRLQEIAAIDFFASPARAQAEAAVQALESRLRPAATRAGRERSGQALVGKTWVTRRGVQVDRIASAWLVRRFVDPDARFRFVDGRTAPARDGEIRFDMAGGEFTHRGERCTFEDLVERLGLDQPGLADVAAIVHDIDLKDAKFSRPEAVGVERLIAGLCRAHSADAERLERGFPFFDDLLRAFSVSSPRPAQARARRRPGQGTKR